jgi:hypothetical protein
LIKTISIGVAQGGLLGPVGFGTRSWRDDDIEFIVRSWWNAWFKVLLAIEI